MAKRFPIHFWFWISVIIQVLSSSSVASKEVPFNPNIPEPQVVFKTPKTPLLQLAWTLPAYQQNDIQRYEVSAIRVSERDHPEIDDPEGDYGPTKVFTCDNDNFNEGLCTISGLSANSRYNVSVRACNANGCGLAAVAYITTSSRTSRLSIISTILVVVCLVIILISSVRSYDVIVELSKYCRKLTSRGIPEREPNVEIQESPSAPNLQDIELTQFSGMIRTTSNERPSNATSRSTVHLILPYNSDFVSLIHS